MTEDEYRKLIEEEKSRHIKAINDLATKFAHANNPHKIGDIISDGQDTIIINKIDVDLSSIAYGYLPCMIYRGQALKKDKTAYKNGRITIIYQTRIINKE